MAKGKSIRFKEWNRIAQEMVTDRVVVRCAKIEANKYMPGGVGIYARVDWTEAGYYDIVIVPGLTPEQEFMALVHEISHIKLGHAQKIARSPEERERRDAIAAAIATGQDIGNPGAVEYRKQAERDADNQAVALLKYWNRAPLQ